MRVTVSRMTLQSLLKQHGIPTIRELSRRLQCSRQQAWDLWHARVGVGAAMMKRLHEDAGIPLESLIQLDPVPWQKRPRQERTKGKSKGSPKKDRGDEVGTT
jgi:transcriptional regulator with XRE-family HTH domain